MRECDNCNNWSQWRGTAKGSDGAMIVRHLCQSHKDADKTDGIKFIFVGAIPVKGKL